MSSIEREPQPRSRLLATSDEAIDELRSLRDLLRWAVSRFGEAHIQTGHGTGSHLDEAVSLALWSLHLAPYELDKWLDARLSRSERASLAALVEARCVERIPSAYLTGEAWLRGVCFRSDARALVPRSLIAEALDTSIPDYLEAFPRSAPWPQHILDLCTGGGSLAVHCALRFQDAQVSASDLSSPALDLARENIVLHGLESRISLSQGDLLEPHGNQTFDLIVCNPPYVCDASMARLPAEYQAEPRLALAGGSDGMDLIRRILAAAPTCLSDDGLLVIEIGHEAEHFERAFPQIEFAYLPVEAGERMLVAIESRALAGKPRRRRARA